MELAILHGFVKAGVFKFDPVPIQFDVYPFGLQQWIVEVVL